MKYDNYFDNNDDHYSDKQVHTCVDVVFPEKNTTDLWKFTSKKNDDNDYN